MVRFVSVTCQYCVTCCLSVGPAFCYERRRFYILDIIKCQINYNHTSYLSFFTQSKFLENKIYTEKRVNYDKRILRQNSVNQDLLAWKTKKKTRSRKEGKVRLLPLQLLCHEGVSFVSQCDEVLGLCKNRIDTHKFCQIIHSLKTTHWVWNYTLSVKLHIECETTHWVWNHTLSVNAALHWMGAKRTYL